MGQVPNTQLILELCDETTLAYAVDEPRPIALEQRLSTTALARLEAERGSILDDTSVGAESVGTLLTPLAVGRAASAAAMAKLDDFYVSGMG